MRIKKDWHVYAAQVLLMCIMFAIPCFYFVQKYKSLQDELYTLHMQEVAQQIDGRLERQVIWKEGRDQARTQMLYTAYYYPEACTVICRTSQILPPNQTEGNAYLVSDTNELYPASLAQNMEWNTSLFVFENIPSDFIGTLSYLDIIPSDPDVVSYDPRADDPDRIRYILKPESSLES